MKPTNGDRTRRHGQNGSGVSRSECESFVSCRKQPGGCRIGNSGCGSRGKGRIRRAGDAERPARVATAGHKPIAVGPVAASTGHARLSTGAIHRDESSRTGFVAALLCVLCPLLTSQMACINCRSPRSAGADLLSAPILISFAYEWNFFIFHGRCVFDRIRGVISLDRAQCPETSSQRSGLTSISRVGL